MAKNKVSVKHSQQVRCFYQVRAVSGGKQNGGKAKCFHNIVK